MKVLCLQFAARSPYGETAIFAMKNNPLLSLWWPFAGFSSYYLVGWAGLKIGRSKPKEKPRRAFFVLARLLFFFMV